MARWQRWGELVPALLLLVVCLGGTRGAGESQGGVPGASAFLLAALAASTLLLRRRAPRLGISVAALATGAYLLLDHPYGPILFVGPVWAWCLAAALPLRRAVPWLAGYLVVVAAAGAPRLVRDAAWPELLAWVTVLGMVLAAGAATGFALAARQRSEAAARVEVARRAVSEERLAMAQDVHDGIGHSLAVIAMQAGVAAHVLERDPARARELLATVVATSREALDGLRADLDRLREPAAPGARRPGPGLADLPVLLDRMRDGGLRLEASLTDAPVPAAVGAAAYRIVQESLTNVLRHAGASEATVLVRLGDRLLVEVADRGPGPVPPAGPVPGRISPTAAQPGRVVPAPARPAGMGPAGIRPEGVRPAGIRPAGMGSAGAAPGGDASRGPAGSYGTAEAGAERGSGIAGMRRRAAEVGGTLTAGPRDGGGFLVRAELPVDAPVRTGAPA